MKTFTTLLASLFVQQLYTAVALPSAQNTVGVQSVISSPLALPDGGPQALEGWTTVSHDRGTTRTAIGTIGNVEMNARGDVTEIRSLQAGGAVTNDGHVGLWSGLSLSQPRAGTGLSGGAPYTGPVHIDRYDYITFDNGWSIRPDGAKLLICDPQHVCRGF